MNEKAFPNPDYPDYPDLRMLRARLREQGLIRCQGRSELSEENDYLETSHLNHSREDLSIYLSPEVIVMCTPVEHYAYHLIFKDCPEKIGLTKQQNYFAIRQCYERMKQYLKRYKQIDFDKLSREERLSIIRRAWHFWSYYLELPFPGEKLNCNDEL
ncbi:MAG: hypothetical protein NZZ41_04285 [Candidatus Dojkabacteria bacterium]|nr:hypothetical protein [Candidatus Dojkabacteria bacterium]